MKTGLVLEGGGVRGIYTAGVLDVFMEKGITFDGVIGVSAGAIHACSYLSGQKGRSIRYYKKYLRDPRFMGIKSLITTGNIVGVDFCYHELPDELDIYDHDAFLANNTPFYAVCTNLKTGKAEYLRIKDLRTQIDVVRASASLPYVSKPVSINGAEYLDGGCSDSIPLETFINMGYKRNVVILTREESYRKKESKGMAGIFYRKYPEFAETLKKRNSEYNKSVEKIYGLAKSGGVFIIRPDAPLNIGRLEKDPEKMQKVYDIGRADGEKYAQALIEWMKTE